MELPGGRSGVVQVAYLTTDVRAAAVRHSETFGSGPFFVSEHIPLEAAWHRGEPAELDHSSAYGQWGSVMVELVCVHAATPASLGAAVKVGATGIHHLARFVENLDAEAERLEGSGMRQVLLARTSSGLRFAFHDGGDLGHLLEIYQPEPGLAAFYSRVAGAAEGWDGSDLLRRL